MKRPSPASLILLAAAIGAGHVAAQSATSVPAPAAADLSTPPVASTTTPAPASGRAVSPQAAALLGAIVPKYVPPASAEAKPAEELPDLREIDRPRNTIIRLPKFLVQEDRPRVFREQDLYTPQALSRRLAKRYYSEGYLAFSKFVHYTPLAFFLPSAEASAMAQFQEEERLRNKAEFTDYTNMLMISNAAAGVKLKGDVQQTFMHWSEMGWSNKSK